MGSTFLRRLKYYGIGFGIGLLVVMFALPNRGCSWTPKNRIKNMILGRVIAMNDVEWQLAQQKGLTKEDIISVLNDGDVDLSTSKKDGESKVYVIQKEIKGNEFTFYFTLPNESFISEVKLGEMDAKNVKNTKEGYGVFVSVPKDDFLIYPDSTSKVKCQLQSLQLSDMKKMLKDVKQTGRINFVKSNLDAKPKAEHYVEYVSQGDTIGFNAVWYKNKIFISNFDSKRIEDCK